MIVVYSGDQDFILYEHQKYLKDVPTAVFEGTAKQLSEKHRFLPFDQTKKYKSEQILVRLDATIELVLPTISFLHNIQQAFPTCRINIEIPKHLAFLVQNGFNIVEPQTDFAVNNYYRVYDYRRSNRRIGMLLEPLVLISWLSVIPSSLKLLEPLELILILVVLRLLKSTFEEPLVLMDRSSVTKPEQFMLPEPETDMLSRSLTLR